MLAAETQRRRTRSKQCKRHCVKRSTVRLVPPDDMCADDRESADDQGKSRVCTPMALLPPARPLEDRMSAPNLHDKNINS